MSHFSLLPTIVVPTGGELFADWIRMVGSRNSKQKLGNLIRDNGHGIDIDEFNDAMFEELQGFQGFLIPSLARISTGCRKQLFYHTRNAAFHGLSRAGIKNMAALGLMMKLSTYDLMCEEENTKNREKIRFEIGYRIECIDIPHDHRITSEYI